MDSLTDADEIRRGIELMTREGETFEVRALDCLPYGKGVVSGYFRDREKAAEAAAQLSRGGERLDGEQRPLKTARGVYVTLNEVDPQLFARAANRLVKADTGGTTADTDIKRRRLLFVEVDPKRPSGVMATEKQREAARELAVFVGKFLRAEYGFPSPLFNDSGSGFHLLYDIDLPNSEAVTAAIKRFLEALAAKFDTDAAGVDRAVFNAARICRLPGTGNCKGDNTEETPHRMASVVKVPATREIVSFEQIEAVAELFPDAPTKALFSDIGEAHKGGLGVFDMAAFIDRHGLNAKGPSPYKAGEKWQIDCLFDTDHTAPDAALFVSDSGAPGFRCLHNSCKGKGFRDVAESFNDKETLARFEKRGKKDTQQKAATTGDRAARSPLPVRLTTMADVKRETVSFLWQGRIAFGKITVLDGDPGLGKSTVALTIAAALTMGGDLPGNQFRLEPADILLLSYEDGEGDTIRPRLEAAGADLYRVHTPKIPDTLPDGSEWTRPPIIPDDLPLLRSVIESKGVRLIIIDPVMAALSGEVNSFRDQDVRRALAPLAQIAEETGAAVLILRHLNKGGGGNALYRGGGSIGISGAARSVLLLAKDPDDEEKRVIAPVKSNLAKFPPSLSFRLEDCGDVAKVVWDGESPHTANGLASFGQESQGEISALEEAIAFLREFLADGEVHVKTIEGEAKNAGIALTTLRRAREKLWIQCQRKGFGADGGSFWSLPEIPIESHTCPTIPIPAQQKGMDKYAEHEQVCNREDAPEPAKAFLRKMLCSQRIGAETLQGLAKGQGISLAELEQARRSLGVAEEVDEWGVTVWRLTEVAQ